MLVSQTQTGFEMALGMAGSRGVGTNRQTEGFFGIANGAEHLGRRALSAGREDHQRCTQYLAIDRDSDNFCIFDDRKCFGVESHISPRSDGHVEKVIVEALSRPHRAVVGETIGGRPRKFTLLLSRNHSQSIDAVSNRVIDA